MGKIGFFDVEKAMREHDLRRFVETGTGVGDSLAFACGFPFTTLWSCDIEPTLVHNITHRFPDERVSLFVGTSAQMLDLLPKLPLDERILFWLDAHFPGADYGLHGYDEIRDEGLRLPLKGELALIKQHRPRNEDIIVIDDARIYVDAPFQEGGIHEAIKDCRPAELGIEFVHELFGDSHRIDLLLDHQGYIVLSPLASSDKRAIELKQLR